MHVTFGHALIYHAWYNYPQISSQDYEVLAAQMQLFFFAQKYLLIRNMSIYLCSYFFFDIEAKKKYEPQKRNTLFPAGHSNGFAIA